MAQPLGLVLQRAGAREKPTLRAAPLDPHNYASFCGMDSISWAAKWVAQHPWQVLCALVILAAVLKLAERLRAGWSSRKGTGLMRSAQEQAQFDPVQTVYAPKGYRRERTPRR